MNGEIRNARAEVERDVGIGTNRIDEHGLQIGAVDDPVWRTVAFLREICERSAGKRAPGARIHYPELFRSNDVLPQLRLKPESNQDARGIGRELNSGTRLFEPLRRLENDHAKPALCHGQGRDEAADTGTGNEDSL